MSRYAINKLLWEIDRTDQALVAFRSDPAGFVAAWEEAEPVPPYPSGGRLTDQERSAFASVDYSTLYALGAHPYLLWHMVRAVLVSEDLSVEVLSRQYIEAIADHGYPDFAT